MAAANTDKFKKAKRKFSTTIGVGGFAAAATTLPLTTTSGLDTDTAITLVLEPGAANEEVITGVVSASNIINCVRGKEGTTDSTHNAGAAVSMYFTETHWDDAMNGILVGHNQDGTHATDSIITSNITNLAITAAKIGAVLTNSNLSTTTGDLGGAWSTYTPTFANTTLGNGTVTGKYIKIGRFVHFYASFKLGTTSAVSSNPTITLPVTASATAFDAGSGDVRIGQTSFEDNGVASYDGVTTIVATSTSATTAKIIPLGTASTYLGPVGVSSTVPFTWGNLDTMRVSGSYEAA